MTGERARCGLYIPLAGTYPAGGTVYCATYEAITASEPDPDLLLDGNEAYRASRFVCSGDRNRFILAHAYLRRVVANHCALSVSGLRLIALENRAPIIVGETGEVLVQLSLSHCRSHVAVAVSDKSPVGVDVENLLPSEQCREIVPIVCSPIEQRQLSLTAPADYAREFLKMWTAKEAVSKAIGLGMSLDFKKISIIGRSMLCNDPYYGYGVAELSIHTCDVAPDCVLSFVVKVA